MATDEPTLPLAVGTAPTRSLALDDTKDERDATFAMLMQGGGGEGDEWPDRPRRGGLRVRPLTAVLLVLVLAAGAFWVGAEVQKNDGTAAASSGGSAAASRLRSLFGAGSGAGAGSSGEAGAAGGTAGAAGGTAGTGTFAPATTGTVTAVEGNTLYLTTSSGKIVKVALSAKTSITRESSVAAKSLQAGDTVAVRGTTSSSGEVAASSVSAFAKGTTTGSDRPDSP